MKVLSLAPNAEFERFARELTTELRKAGTEANCWSAGEANEMERRARTSACDKLQHFAAELMTDVSRSAVIPEGQLRVWAESTSNSLFAVAAASLLAREFSAGRWPDVIYLDWQTGLLDSAGHPTPLGEVLEEVSREGRATVIIHADRFYEPAFARFAASGMAFHAVAPWITQSLLEMGVSPDAVAEIPPGVDTANYASSHELRARQRAELRIPAHAFVLFSQGAQDCAENGFAALAKELTAFGSDSQMYWVVSSSRGDSLEPWEAEARAAFGARFIELRGEGENGRAELCAIADVYVDTRKYHAWGREILEAQLAGLPFVLRDDRVTRWLAAKWAGELMPVSVVDAEHAGAIATAVRDWRRMLSDTIKSAEIRGALAAFRECQCQRFAWDFVCDRYMRTFRNFSRTGAGRERIRWWRRPPDEKLHERGKLLFAQGRTREAIPPLAQSLRAAESSERWNDWATAQLSCGLADEAEVGFRRAFELDPHCPDVAGNLGLLLASQKKFREAIAPLESAFAAFEGKNRDTIASVLAQCRADEREPEISHAALRKYLGGFCGAGENERAYFLTHLERYIGTLQLLPQAAPGQRILELGAAFHHITPALVRWKKFAEVRCADVWEGESQTARRVTSANGEEEHTFTVDNFDLHSAHWPYAAAWFDAVLFCEMLEHLQSDPMHVMSEINRILRPGGLLLLTTPNMAGARNVASILRGETPYSWGQYEAGGRPTDRHNREYTPGEVNRLATAAGFAAVRLETPDCWAAHRAALPMLAAEGLSVARRGDSIFLLARKTSAVVERYPSEFYLEKGIQQGRRDEQSISASEPVSAPTPVESTARRAAYLPLRVLVVHDQLPHFDQGGSEVRLMQVLREFRAQGHAVTFLGRNGANWNRYAPPLQELGIITYAHDAERLCALGVDTRQDWTLEEVLRLGRFDLAILCQWFWSGIPVTEQYLTEIRRLAPASRIAILTDDRHGVRELRMEELTHNLADLERGQDFQGRELEIYRQADWLMCITEDDRRGLRELAPELDIELLPMIAEESQAGPKFSARRDLLFLGSFTNFANLDAVHWFLANVWPEVHRELPGVTLHLVGNAMPTEFLCPAEGVVGIGQVADVEPLFALHRVFVSPIRFGTGIKTKNLAALAHGLPTVTTEVGAEGMNLVEDEHALIVDDAREFARAIVSLYRDESLWEKLAVEGRNHAQKEFSPMRLREQVERNAAKTFETRPKKYDPGFVPSGIQVEREFPIVLTHKPAKDRLEIRAAAFVDLAERLLAEGRHGDALAQLRHIFFLVRGPISADSFFQRVLRMMEQCYRDLGDAKSAARCAAELRAALPASVARSSSRKKARQRTAGEPTFSVIIPTYNRLDTLRKCLGALAKQTYPAKEFEVVVVDDGSSDGTAEFCGTYAADFRLKFIRRANAGPGAARRAGVAAADGEFLLLINDDTIADPQLIAEHQRVQVQHSKETLAVLGNFRYPAEARRRALTHFLSIRPFLFFQSRTQPGSRNGYAHFVTCNLSVRRKLVVDAGSFDERFHVGEDTELGARLERRGLRVYYHPAADAIHDHLSIATEHLVSRARAYGRADVMLFHTHPYLLGGGTGPFGRMDTGARRSMEAFVAQHRSEVEEAVRALRRFDAVDFTRFFDITSPNGSAADDVMALFDRAVPMIHWTNLYESFLEVWAENTRENSAPAEQAEQKLQVARS